MAVEIKSEQINEENRGLFLEMCEKDGRRKMESKISGMVGIDSKEVIIDIPNPERIKNKINNKFSKIPIYDEGKVRSMRNYSEITRTLEGKNEIPWALSIICPKDVKEEISTKSKEMLF